MVINENYIDEHGNYINRQNLTLAEIYTNGYIDGYTSKSTDPEAPDIIEKLTAEMVGIIKDTIPQIIEAAKDYTRPTAKWEEPFEHNGKSYHKCSNCHISSELILIGAYCPSCGARMITTEGGKI